MLHWVNAYEDGDEIVLDGFFQDDPVPRLGDGTLYQRMFRFLDSEQLQTAAAPLAAQPDDRPVKEERLTDTVSEFGMINQQHAGRRYRYSYAATAVPGWFLFNGIVKHDVVTGREERYDPRRRRVRQRDRDGPARRLGREDDGYLVTITTDMNRDLSECLVFDAHGCRRPVVRVRLPERVSSGTHSTWAPGASVPDWRA